MAKATDIDSGRNRNEVIPGITASGDRTSRVLRLETSSGRATSLAPSSAETLGGNPSSRWRSVFSRQMIALSTIGPIASARPESVMTLIVCPARYRKTIAERTDSGIVMTAIAVICQRPRNSRIVSEQRAAPSSLPSPGSRSTSGRKPIGP